MIRLPKTPFILFAMLCMLVTGCSNTQLFYNHADWLLGYRANGYFDLTSEQKPAAKLAIANWLSWHRRSQLSCYAGLIDQFETRAADQLTVADMDWLRDEFQRQYQTLVNTAMPAATQILVTLDRDQIAHLEKRLAKDRKKLVKQLKLKPQKRLRERAQKTVDGLPKWFGKLSSAQVDWLMQQSQQLPDTYALWVDYRTERDRRLIEMLRASRSQQVLIETLSPFWADPESVMAAAGPDTAILMAKMRVAGHDMAVGFYQLTSHQQRDHFWQRMQEYRRDFLQLASAESNASCQSDGLRQAGTPPGSSSDFTNQQHGNELATN
ncbi:MAG: hypothetical protein JKY89_04090 [Immundisolibacteraceae bacterium]|nr:hypothetical protein [Immundisolibacteraceae bacterium]